MIELENITNETEATTSSQRGKPVDQWDINDVAKWVRELGLGQYEERFRDNAIDGTELMTLQQDTLERSLGISK